MNAVRALLFLSMLTVPATSTFAQNIERMFQTDVQVYLVKDGVPPNNAADLFLRPVERMVPNDFKIEYALRALFDEEDLTEEEIEAGYSLPTFGLRFEGLAVRAGTATVKFSQPPGKMEFEGLAPMVFNEAIEKTARQFRSIKRVRICAVGKTTILNQFDRPFERCR